MSRQQNIVIGSLCYILYEQSVLLLRRANPPYKGLWSPPGGKMEFGESPQECCIREIREETNILIEAPQLRAIQTVIDIAIPIHWQLFIYRAMITKKPIPHTQLNHTEGDLCWYKLSDLDAIDRPYTDKQVWSHIISDDPAIHLCKFVYDTPDSLLDELVY